MFRYHTRSSRLDSRESLSQRCVSNDQLSFHNKWLQFYTKLYSRIQAFKNTSSFSATSSNSISLMIKVKDLILQWSSAVSLPPGNLNTVFYLQIHPFCYQEHQEGLSIVHEKTSPLFGKINSKLPFCSR